MKEKIKEKRGKYWRVHWERIELKKEEKRSRWRKWCL